MELPIKVSEELRQKLLKEERKMRSKQPEAWTKTKYRKYANFGKAKLKGKSEEKSEEAKGEAK